MAYTPERYLEPVRNRGYDERRDQAAREKKDYRLLPLTPSEQLYASAVCLELADVSSYSGHVSAFLQGNRTKPREGRGLNGLWVELNNLNLRTLSTELTDGELDHLTRYLLYEAGKKLPEMDILVVLPLQHRIIGIYI